MNTSRKIIFLLTIIPFFYQCNPPAEKQEKAQLLVEVDTLYRQKGNCESTDCIDAHIIFPHFSGTVAADQINQQVKELIYYDLLIDSAKVDQLNMQELADELIRDYENAKEEFKEATLNFEYNITSEVTYRHPRIWSINFNIYTYTGGAHPMTYQKYLNVDPDTGEKIDLGKFFTNQDELKRLVEREIRETHDIETEQLWSDVFFTERFQWPENMGLTNDGLVLVYNPYEILPYAAGFTEVIIPLVEAGQYLSIDLQTEAEEALQ